MLCITGTVEPPLVFSTKSLLSSFFSLPFFAFQVPLPFRRRRRHIYVDYAVIASEGIFPVSPAVFRPRATL
jgi:hypothetical protein